MTAVGVTQVRAVRRRALETILPSDAETMLLRALLWPGDDGEEAWRHWSQTLVAPLPERGRLPDNVKALLPLLHSALRAKGVTPEGTFASYIRAAYVREELRGRAYRRILGALLDAAAGTAVWPIIILGGRALAETVYREPDSRHSDGIRLLIRERDGAAFDRILPGLEYQRTTSRVPGMLASWVHRSGLHLELRTALLAPPHDRLIVDGLVARSMVVPGLHASARTLCAEDELFRVCARAAISRSRLSLRWACDAWLLMDKYGDRLDWRLVMRRARETGTSLALSVILDFLARDLHAAIPGEILAEFEADAGRADDLHYEMALLAALPGSHARMWGVIRTTPGLRLRLAVLRPLVLPTPSALGALQRDGGSVALAYWVRPMRYLRGRFVTLIRSIAHSRKVVAPKASRTAR